MTRVALFIHDGHLPWSVVVCRVLERLDDGIIVADVRLVRRIEGEVLKAHQHLGEYVFLTREGEPLTCNTMRKPFERILRAAGLRYIRFHKIRHSFASQLIINGVPLKSVQELLGHSYIRQTMIYSHLSLNVNRDAICTLNPLSG